MSKLFKLVALIGFAAISAASCNEGTIDNLQKQIDQLKTGEIASISKQIEAINTTINGLKASDDALKGYITALQKDGETYKAQIAELTAADKVLEGKIAELKTYAESGIKDAKDWASATFATLEQLNSLSEVVASISSRVNQVSENLDSAKKEITAAYQKAIAEAVASLETSMKSWVNDKLTGYYTIAQIDAKLDSLAKAHDGAIAGLKDQFDDQKSYADSLAGAHDKTDSLLRKQIDEQKEALKKAKEEITAAYQEAIKKAIEEYDGKIDVRIAESIASATADLQARIDAVSKEISGILARLEAAEAQVLELIKMIQSVSVIPTYSDGSVQYSAGKAETLSFDIKPESAADALVNLWLASGKAKRDSLISFKIKGMGTKAGAEPSATISSVLFLDGEVKIDVTFENLPENPMASLQIKAGVNEISSNFFNICLQ